MSKMKFDAMPKEDQELFLKTGLEVAKFQRKLNRDSEEARMKEMASQGVTVTRDVDRESFRKAMAPTFDQFSSQFPKPEIQNIMNAK
jgi:TRAP-type C4-dicarboxylate transport system substrate-binding protein